MRYYGKWMRDEAEKRIGHLYPKIEITAEMATGRPDLKPYVGQKLTVIAWLWARTVKSPNPAFAQVDVPLVSTFMLSTKPGKEAYVDPVIENGGYRFTVKVGTPADPAAAKSGTKMARANFACIMSGTPVSGDYIKSEGKAGRMGARLMAIVAEGAKGRVYLSPTAEHEAVISKAKPTWRPEGEIAARMTGGNCTPYGLTSWGDLFTPRQLVALTTFSDLVGEAIERVKKDATSYFLNSTSSVEVNRKKKIENSESGTPPPPSTSHFLDTTSLSSGGTGSTAYAEAVGVYLAFAVDKGANYWSSLCSWHGGRDTVTSTFGRQALPMIWDFAEANPFSSSSGNYLAGIDQSARHLNMAPGSAKGVAEQLDAAIQRLSTGKVLSTDPPYYDNIGYADLSDFFYVWLRQSLRPVFPHLFATLAVPKAAELVATPYRHGSKEKAEEFFLSGMTQAMHCLAENAHLSFPVSIYYAFRQSENQDDTGTASTGWETFLDAVIRADLGVNGTWPMRTEYTGNLKKAVNALASSIVLVCRPRSADAPTATRREFVTTLQRELPEALRLLQKGNIAPVDLAQASIGPGMAVFTRYAKVLDAQGKTMTVREALALINQILDEALAEQEGDFDADSRWALAWFDQNGFEEGEFGVADVLARAKNTAVEGLVEAGIVKAGRGRVRLLRPGELPADWDPAHDARLTAWEMVHQLIRVLGKGGERAAARLVAQLGSRAEVARELAYRLYTTCERKKRATEALSYNALVQSWPEIVRLAKEGFGGPEQDDMLV